MRWLPEGKTLQQMPTVNAGRVVRTPYEAYDLSRRGGLPVYWLAALSTFFWAVLS
jgi:hypothetical protein